MDGFTTDVPIAVAVTWLPKNADGTLKEIPLVNGKPFPYGLLAETSNAATGVLTRWFVPWTSVVYIRQDQPIPVVPPAPTVPTPVPTPADPPDGKHNRRTI